MRAVQEVMAELLQLMGTTANFGPEGMRPARDLPQIAHTYQCSLFGVLPVHSVDLDFGVVVEPRGQIFLVQALGGQHALDVEIIDAQSDGACDLAGGKASVRLECGALERDIAVMIGEAEDHAIGAREVEAAPVEGAAPARRLALEGGAPAAGAEEVLVELEPEEGERVRAVVRVRDRLGAFDAVRGVVAETVDPADVFSWRGVVRSLAG